MNRRISKSDVRFLLAMILVTIVGLTFSAKAYAINRPNDFTFRSQGVIKIDDNAIFDVRDLWALHEICK